MTMADITEQFRFVEESVWQWILLPVEEGPMTVEDVFASARVDPPARWLRGIEDRREGASKFELVEMTSDTTPPPIDGDGLDAVGPPGRDS